MLCNANLNQFLKQSRIEMIPIISLIFFITSSHDMYTNAENLPHVISSTDIIPIYLYKW